MAVQSSAGRTVPLFVLIIFIVLFLAATTGVVLLFVHQETVRQNAERDKAMYDTYVGPGIQARLDQFKSVGTSRKTAVANLLDDRDQLAALLTGNKVSTPKEARERLDKALLTLPVSSDLVKKFGTVAQSDLIGAMTQAAQMISAVLGELAKVKEQLATCQKERETVTAQYAELVKTFAGKEKEFLAKLTELDAALKSYNEKLPQQIEELKTAVSTDVQGKLTRMGKDFNIQVDELRDMVRRNLRVLIKSAVEMGPAEMRAASLVTLDQLTQKIDGEVLDVAGPVVYISLGTRQGVKPGMRFTVVPSGSRGQATPKIKAILEVTKTADLTAECQVLRSLPADPVLRGDGLLNLVYDPAMKMMFFVMGDFDLSQTGMVDPNGARRVSDIVVTNGGKLSTQLSPSVNFVIMGAPPQEETAGGEGDDKGSSKVKTYNDQKEQIQSMGIPVITPDVFAKYTGYADKLEP